MNSQNLTDLHKTHKEQNLFGRYITNDMVTPIMNNLPSDMGITCLGKSVELRPIYSITVGNGNIKVLLWSQMHGNESTTTKALFDLLNVFKSSNALNDILESCTLCIVPILNPDGAHYYTRLNANAVDLNRDAQDLTQPESKILRTLYDDFKPHYCCNLHGQRTIFGAGNQGNPATLSFLSPSADADRSITNSRKVAMAIIASMTEALKLDLPEAIGRYDDGFNLNCVGDTFQALKTPTVLFEAGHYDKDYTREHTRLFVFKALIYALKSMTIDINDSIFKSYFDIPENQKNFYDIIIRNATLEGRGELITDIAVQFEEVLHNNEVHFRPVVAKIGNLKQYFAHKEIQANNNEVLGPNLKPIKEGNEIDFVMLKNQQILMKS